VGVGPVNYDLSNLLAHFPLSTDQRQWVLSRYLEVCGSWVLEFVSIFKSNKGFSRAALVPEKQHRIVTSSVDFLKFSHLLRTWLE